MSFAIEKISDDVVNRLHQLVKFYKEELIKIYNDFINELERGVDVEDYVKQVKEVEQRMREEATLLPLDAVVKFLEDMAAETKTEVGQVLEGVKNLEREACKRGNAELVLVSLAFSNLTNGLSWFILLLAFESLRRGRVEVADRLVRSVYHQSLEEVIKRWCGFVKAAEIWERSFPRVAIEDVVCIRRGTC